MEFFAFMPKQNKSPGRNRPCRSFLLRHRPDARGALQQSPILQSDLDNLWTLRYNGNNKLKSLRSFTQLDEQTPSSSLVLRFCCLPSLLL